MNAKNSVVLKIDDQRPEKSGNNAAGGYISQIPGLSPSIRTITEEKTRGRRTVVLESDSAYVKLAKQGGHKGLLSHEEIETPASTSYKPPDWFCNESGDIKEKSKEKDNPGAFLSSAPPFGSDNMSTWERDGAYTGEKDKKADASNSLTDELQRPAEIHGPNKYKKVIFDKNPAPVDMSKLLSFGYAGESRPVG